MQDVYIETRPDSIRMLCSNGEVQAEVIIPAVHTMEDFKMHLNYKLFLAACSNITDEMVEIKFPDGKPFLSIASDRSKYKIDFATDSFPIIPFTSQAAVIVQPSFIDALKKSTGFANKNDSLRTFVSGITLVSDANYVRLYATDGITMYKHMAPSSFDFELVIIPHSGALAVAKICLGNEVSVGVSDRATRWVCNEYMITVSNLQKSRCDFDGIFSKFKEFEQYEYSINEINAAAEKVFPFCGEHGFLKFWKDSTGSYISATDTVGNPSAHEMLDMFSQGPDFETFANKDYAMKCFETFIDTKTTIFINPNEGIGIASENEFVVMRIIRFKS